MKVLINAYACSPHMGSEPGMAWNWIINLSNFCDLVVITEGEFKEQIEFELQNLNKTNIVFHYLPVSEKIRRICWNQGDWRFYRYYRIWQKRAYIKAKEIIDQERIDICHHLNMIGFREPGYFWKIKNIPFVWGPTSVDYEFPLQYISKSDLKNLFFFWLKNEVTKFQFKYSSRVKSAINASSLIIVANSKSKNAFLNVHNVDTLLLNETGLNIKKEFTKTTNPGSLNLLWVGKFDFRKQLGLALETLSELKDNNIKLHIVGHGDEKYYKEKASFLRIEHKCIFYGKLQHREVQEMMQKFDALFFPSISEGTPHVVLEAISNQMPVICFDTCGQGDVVTEETGFKVKLTNPYDSKKLFVKIINEISTFRELLNIKSRNCRSQADVLSWLSKAEYLKRLYDEVLE